MSGAVKKSVINQFVAITGTTLEVAKNLLEACNGNLDVAIGMHMDGATGAGEAVQAAAHTPAEEDVRAPIPQTNEVLVSEQPVYGFRAKKRKTKSVFDGFRDFQAEARQQELQQSTSGTGSSSKRKTLEELFRPPIDLLHRGSFQSARDLGCSRNRWVMVNIQNVAEFPCQVLNRDVWSNNTVRTIVQGKFILWQVYHDTEEGEKYCQFYPINHWPYVAIIDPRTGEKMAEWCKLDAMVFCDLVGEFLSVNPFPGSSTSSSTSSPPVKKQKKRDSIIDSSEDSQLQAAIQASMSETVSKPKVEELVFTDSDDNFDAESDDLETFSDSDDESDNKDSSTKTTSNSKPSSSLSPQKPCSSHSASSSSSSTAGKNKSVLNGYQGKAARTDSDIISKQAGSISLDNSNKSPQKKRWKLYLGDESGEKTTILLRFPGGQRQQLCIPRTSQLRALTEYMVESGYSQLKHELLTNFPKRNLSEMDQDTTLESVGLFPQETVFVHENEES